MFELSKLMGAILIGILFCLDMRVVYALEAQKGEIKKPIPIIAKGQTSHDVRTPLVKDSSLLIPLQKKGHGSFKVGFRGALRSCIMHSLPNDLSDDLRVVKTGQKVWLDQSTKGWYRGSIRKEKGYFNGDCFE